MAPSPTSAKMGQVNTPQLMELPREVRDSIWDFSTDGPIHYKMPKCTPFCRWCHCYHPAHTTETACKQSSTPYEDEYSIFFVSKQIRRESLRIFHKSPFTLELSDICAKEFLPFQSMARRCMLRNTILFRSLYTSASIHNDIFRILYDDEFVVGFHKLRQITIDLGTLDLLCSCDGELCTPKETITLPKILHTMSKALLWWRLTPKWAPSLVSTDLHDGLEMRGIQTNVKAKICFVEERHERRLVS